MKLWSVLYLTIWVLLLEFLLAMIPIAPPFLSWLHLVVGFVIVGLTYANYWSLRRTRVPGRVKRIARATYGLSIFMVGSGLFLFFGLGARWLLPGVGVSAFHFVLFLHIVNALAMITQAAAVAIAFDMWEDREFEKESLPGDVPPQATRETPAP